MKVQYNGFRGGIYSCHQTQHDNYLKFIIWCVYLPGITKFCNYPFDICDKRNDRLWYIWPWKTRTEHLKTEITNLILACYIYFMTHKSRPNTIIHYLIMLITVVLSSKLNFLKKKKGIVVKDCSGVSGRKNLVTINE